MFAHILTRRGSATRRRLRVAQILWIAVTLLAVLLWILAVPTEWHRLETVCGAARSANTCSEPHLTTTALHQLERLGLSRSAFAAFFLSVDALFGLLFICMGVLIVYGRPDEPIALLAGFFLVPFGVGESVDLQAFGASHPLLQWPALTVQALAGASAFPFLYLFPDGRFVPRWTRWIALGFAALFILYTYLPAWGIQPGSRFSGGFAASGAIAATGVLFSHIYRFRRVSGATERQQVKWPMLGIAVALIGLAFIALSQAISGSGLSGLGAIIVGNLVWYGLVSLIPLSLGLAILRYRLWDIDLIVNRTLVYAGLTAIIVAVYVLVVGGLGALLRDQGNVLVSLIAAGVVAVLFQPVRDRLQQGVNRVMYGDRRDPYAVISRLGRRLEDTLSPDSVLPAIVQTVASALKLPYAAITLPQGDSLVVAAAIGSPPPNPHAFPLVYRGETVGELVLGPRAGEGGFSGSDRRLLDDLARQAGIAAYAVRLTADLQHSRQRLVTTREEERRRLRRDLHDGLGPALASVTLMADAALNLLQQDPAAARSLLVDLKAETQAATAEIRRVVYQLRPPALDELGLVPALREQAAQYAHSGLRVSVEAPEQIPPLPAAVEVAAYRIVTEAMTNIVRHARARNCTVRIQVTDGLHTEITDDGQGLNGARTGVGLTSMRERAEELGGRCTVESCPSGGTSVRAFLPTTSE
jgi:signal transduction histidine kinase